MISRRRLILGTGATLLAISSGRLFAREDIIPLWQDEPPGGGGRAEICTFLLTAPGQIL